MYSYDQGLPWLIKDAGVNALYFSWDGANRLNRWLNARLDGLNYSYTADGLLATNNVSWTSAPNFRSTP